MDPLKFLFSYPYGTSISSYHISSEFIVIFQKTHFSLLSFYSLKQGKMGPAMIICFFLVRKKNKIES